MVQYSHDDIKTLQGLEHIRKFPGMYIKSPSVMESQIQICKELLDNATDEATVSPDKHHVIDIVFFHNASTYQILIIDKGRGIPVSMLAQVFSTLNTSGKWGSAYQASTGIYGVGAKATVALSERFVSISNRQVEAGMVDIQKGVVVNNVSKNGCIVPCDNNANHLGTLVWYQPDASIFHDVDKFMVEGYQGVLNIIKFSSTFIPNISFNVGVCNYLVKPSVFNGTADDIWNYFHTLKNVEHIDIGGKQTPEEYVRSVYDVRRQISIDLGNIYKELKLSDPNDVVGYDIRLFFTDDITRYSYGLIGAVNMTVINDPTSFHITGLVDAIKQKMIGYIENTDISTFFELVYKLPIYGSVIVKYKGASFVGQTKDAFKDRMFLRHYSTCLHESFVSYSDGFWETLYQYLEEDILDKYNKYYSKDMLSSKGLKNIGLQLNNMNCYIGCKSSDNRITELFIAEGDSAAGAAAQSRNSQTQAIFKMRGKPINAFKYDDKKLRANALYQDLVRILGVTPNDKDLSKCNFSKIGILTDADSDGHHITALLVGNLYKINPLLIEEGRVFLTNPPLYTLKIKQNKLFIRDKRALLDTKISQLYGNAFSIKISVNNLNVVKELDGEAFRAFCYMVTRVGEVIDAIATKLSIDQLILESLVSCVDYLDPMNMDPNKIAEILQIEKVVIHKETDNLILVIGSMEITIPMNGLVSAIKGFILPELELANWDKYTCLLTTKGVMTCVDRPMTLYQVYQIMSGLDQLITISRYKGLGEMSPKDLGVTCLNPITRCYTTINTVGDVDRIYAMLGVNTEARKSLNEMTHVYDFVQPQ